MSIHMHKVGEVIDLYLKSNTITGENSDGSVFYSSGLNFRGGKHNQDTYMNMYYLGVNFPQPAASGGFLCEVTRELQARNDNGVAEYEVRTLHSLPICGEELQLTFQWDAVHGSWDSIYAKDGFKVVFTVMDKDAARLGPRNPSNRPLWTVKPVQLKFRHQSGLFRVMYVALVAPYVPEHMRKEHGAPVLPSHLEVKGALPIQQKKVSKKAKHKKQVTAPATDAVVGKANCGCVHHAEEGVPCEHDIALARSK